MMMRAKAFLKQCRREIAEYRLMVERLEWLRGTLLPAAIRYRQVDVQNSVGGDKLSEVMPEIVELEGTLFDRVQILAEHQTAAEIMISRLENPQHRTLLRLYYLHDPVLTWAEVADRMHYSEDAVKHMHGYALLNLTRNNTL